MEQGGGERSRKNENNVSLVVARICFSSSSKASSLASSPFFNPAHFFIIYDVGGVRHSNENVRSEKAVSFTGNGISGIWFFVRSLNSFTNWAMFTPRGPSACPIDGPGFAVAEGTRSITFRTTDIFWVWGGRRFRTQGQAKEKKKFTSFSIFHFQIKFSSNFLLSFCVNFLPKPRTLITCRFQVYVVNIKKSWGCGTTSCISTIEHLFDLSGCPLLWLPPLFAPPF